MFPTAAEGERRSFTIVVGRLQTRRRRAKPMRVTVYFKDKAYRSKSSGSLA